MSDAIINLFSYFITRIRITALASGGVYYLTDVQNRLLLRYGDDEPGSFVELDRNVLAHIYTYTHTYIYIYTYLYLYTLFTFSLPVSPCSLIISLGGMRPVC